MKAIDNTHPEETPTQRKAKETIAYLNSRGAVLIEKKGAILIPISKKLRENILAKKENNHG
jgi:hypothetical protein